MSLCISGLALGAADLPVLERVVEQSELIDKHPKVCQRLSMHVRGYIIIQQPPAFAGIDTVMLAHEMCPVSCS